MASKYYIKGYAKYNPSKEEHWDIRWHKDSPCSSCKTFNCPVTHPFCSKYRKFLQEQLAIQNTEKEKIDNIIQNSYIYKNKKAKDENNVKSRKVDRNNRKDKSDRRK